MKDVKNFNEIIKEIFYYFGEITEYPSSIDFQQAINQPELVMYGVFGKDWDTNTSGINNVDYVIQGDITLEPFAEEVDEAEDPEAISYLISGERVFSKDYAKDNLFDLDKVFGDGYMPVLSVRRGEKGRKNIPGIAGSRTAIQAEKGREVNFMISKDSTPQNINFEPIELSKRQLTNVGKFVKYLKDEQKLVRKPGNLLDRLLRSIKSIEPEETP